MTKPTSTTRYTELIELAEAHYTQKGFVKWSDLASELGISRQRILQLMQQAVCLGHLTADDLDRYRSEASRRAAARTNETVRRDLEKLKIRMVLTPENYQWLTDAITATPTGTTTGDLINTAITHFRTSVNV